LILNHILDFITPQDLNFWYFFKKENFIPLNNLNKKLKIKNEEKKENYNNNKIEKNNLKNEKKENIKKIDFENFEKIFLKIIKLKIEKQQINHIYQYIPIKINHNNNNNKKNLNFFYFFVVFFIYLHYNC
jgi:hypothetical protein